MIGVAVHPSERAIVAEFFELFKTPWEFFRSGGQYDVVLCTSDDFRIEGRQLVVILAGVATPFDTTQNTQVKSRLGGFLVSDEGKRIADLWGGGHVSGQAELSFEGGMQRRSRRPL